MVKVLRAIVGACSSVIAVICGLKTSLLNPLLVSGDGEPRCGVKNVQADSILVDVLQDINFSLGRVVYV